MKKIILLNMLSIVLIAIYFISTLKAADANGIYIYDDETPVKAADSNEVKKTERIYDENIEQGSMGKADATTIEQAWKDIEEKGSNEINQWLKTDAENIAVLAKDVNEVLVMELMLLKRIAQEEKAEKTLQAIDKMIEIKTQKCEQILEKARDEKRQRILQQREERKARAAERRGRRRDEQMEQ